MKTAASRDSLMASLTDRQRKVLEMVARGATNPEIAAKLEVSLDGAKWHLREIFAKLGVDSREEAAELWREHRSFGVQSKRRLRALIGWTTLKLAAGGAALAGVAVAAAVAIPGGGSPATEAESDVALATPQVEAFVYTDGSSMYPAIAAGARLPLDVLAYARSGPERGDIVAFAEPSQGRAGGPPTVVVKRVVGLPGETVELRDGTVHINGEPLDEPHATASDDNMGPVLLLDGEYFMLGDNRDNSLDSRSPTIGPIPADLIIGRIALDPTQSPVPSSTATVDPTPPAP